MNWVDSCGSGWTREQLEETFGDRVVTSCVCPPIPMRDFDWCAYLESEVEGAGCGWGRTELDALKDLTEHLTARMEEQAEEGGWNVQHSSRGGRFIDG